MSTQAKFFFTGNSDQFTKALSQVKKSMKQVATQTVVLQAGLKLLSATVNAVAKTLTTVLGAAIKGVVNLVKSALNVIKALVTGAFKFIKTALTTLLSWITKALGKVFDWIGNMFKTMGKVAAKTVDIAKKTVKQIAQSVQAYADKEYNQIQLKLGLGDSYEAVMKDFRNLVKYTTSGRDELLDVYSTFTDMGKKPEEVVKYARAAVYLSNATGRSLSQITRLLLGQEAAGRDLEKVLNRVGVSLSGQEESVSNVERIINTLDEEMTALAKGSLNQLFANIKNDVIAIKENIGYIFSGPVRYIADKIEKLLDRIAGSNKIEGLADKLNQAFDSIKPYIDKVFNFLEKIVQDPAGFLEALWKDIQTIWNNLTTNFNKYLNIFGYILGEGIREVINAIGKIDWTGVSSSFSELGKGLSEFVLSFGKGVGLFDNADDSLYGALVNAWNRAIKSPELKMSESDPWYKNLLTMLKAAWTGLKDLWTDVFSPWWSEIWPKIKDTLVDTFKYLGTVLGVAINNAIASSDVIRKVLNVIPGVNFATEAEAAEIRNSLYNKAKGQLPAGWTAADLTRENLLNTKYNDNQTMLYHLWATVDGIDEEIAWLRKYTVLEQQEYPSFDKFISDVSEVWNPVEEAAQAVIEVTDEMQAELNRRKSQIESNRFNFNLAGPKPGINVMDIPGIPHFARGGIITEPTLAVVGEGGGKEYIIPEEAIPNGSTSFNWRSPFSSAASALGYGNVVVYDYGESAIKKWADSTEVAVEEGTEEAQKETIPWYKKLWNAVKAVGAGIGKYIGGTVGLLAQNGAFGTHLGNIYNGSFDENGTFSILKMFGAIIQELLPYLQKGLQLIGGLFDQAFEIFGNAVQILGERLGNVLLPILESFIPFMKVIADIVIALAPVAESILKPAVTVIAAILQALVPILEFLMPAFAGIGAVVQTVSEGINWIIASLLNWLASIHIGGWYPFGGLGYRDPGTVHSVGENFNNIMSSWDAARANTATGISTSSTGTAGQTASYSGATRIYMTNDFSGAYVVGNNGFKELALIIRDTLEDAEYYRQ